jgi:hypothetical protein
MIIDIPYSSLRIRPSKEKGFLNIRYKVYELKNRGSGLPVNRLFWQNGTLDKCAGKLQQFADLVSMNKVFSVNALFQMPF